MYLHCTSKSITLGPKFEFDDFPALMQTHMKKFPGVAELEQEAKSLVAVSFRFPELESYIRNVCRWGNFAGVGGRVIKNNTQEDIRAAFTDANTLLGAAVPSPSAALARLNMIHGLGTPSFASKHLRFIRPEVCPVYDAILTDKLPYAFDPDGYSEFSADCQRIARDLNAAKVTNPCRASGWLAADVEAAMFARFYE